VKCGNSQRSVAEQYGISKNTLQHWVARKNDLQGRSDPNVVNFFESPSGLAWLHQMSTATILCFHQVGQCGIPLISKYFTMVGINLFIGSSIPALQRVANQMDEELINFGNEEKAQLGPNMPLKDITIATDENFHTDQMTLISMDPASGMILSEQLEEKRDTLTWERVVNEGIKGLNIRIIQVTGDAAQGLTKLALDILHGNKSPDLFHVQQDITKGLTSTLARRVQQTEKALQDIQEQKKEDLGWFSKKLKEVGSVDALGKRDKKRGKRALKMEEEEKATKKKLEKVKEDYRQAQETRRMITDTYHPFNLDTGEKQEPEEVKFKLENAYNVLEKLAKDVECTEKQQEKLKKSRGMVHSMIQTLMFFFAYLQGVIQAMGLSTFDAKVFQTVVSLEYLNLCLKKTKKKKAKVKLTQTILKLETELKHHPRWIEIGPEQQEIWRRKALESALVFQRSSSCVEGRNSILGLKFHAFRRLSARKLTVCTVLHNFFIQRRDGTTAAERFFGQKPRDLFTWLLDRMDMPTRPRKRHTVCKKKKKEELVAKLPSGRN
jgi:hypothetical protein